MKARVRNAAAFCCSSFNWSKIFIICLLGQTVNKKTVGLIEERLRLKSIPTKRYYHVNFYTLA